MFQVLHPSRFQSFSRGVSNGLPSILLVALVGCSTEAQKPVPKSAIPAKDSRAAFSNGTNTPPSIRPIGGTLGRVAQVNERLRFVVLEFPLNPVPAFGQRLELVRNEVVCGEVKVSAFAQGAAVAADIVSGDAAVGDLVRLK